MNDRKFQIFIPFRIKWLRLDWCILLLIILCSAICYISDEYIISNVIYDISMSIGLILLLTLFIIFVFGSYIREPLFGRIEGILELRLDKLLINDREILLSQISKLSFHFNDYWNRSIPISKYNYNPRLSQGVENQLVINLLNGEEIKLQFKQMYSGEQYKCKYELFEYYICGKYTIVDLSRFLGRLTYAEIQILKQEIEEYKKNRHE